MLIRIIYPVAFCLVFLLRVSDSNIGDYQRVAVSCANDYIRIELNATFFNSSKYESITLRNNSCKAVSSNNTISLISIKNGCGTTKIETTDKIAFENDVILRVKMSVSDVTSSDHDQILSIRCIYEKGQSTGVSSVTVVDFNKTKGIVSSIEGTGSFALKLAMYKSKAYKHRHHVYPVRVRLRDFLFFQASANVKDSHLTLFIDRCYSTPSMNRTHHKEYVIIEDGCAIDNTVQFHQGNSHDQRFSIQAFRYSGQDLQIVYVHCKLTLCHRFSKEEKFNQSACFRNNMISVNDYGHENSTSEKSINFAFSLIEARLKLINEAVGSINLNDNRAVVTCNSNYILVALNTKNFNASSYGRISFRDKRCKAVISKDRISLVSIPNGCGASIKVTAEEIIFENAVILEAKVPRNPGTLHHQWQSISVRCMYKRSEVYTLSFDPRLETCITYGFGRIFLKLAMYQSNAYRHSHRVYPVTVNTGDRLFFQASAVVDNPRLLLLIDRCYSTPNMNRTHHKKYAIIENGCPKDSTVQFHKGSIQSQRFSFEAFRHIGEPTTTMFIHCELFFCDKLSKHGKCHIGCSSNILKRMRHNVSAHIASEIAMNTESYLIEIGPIINKQESNPSKQDDVNKVNVKLIMLVIGVAALAIGVIVLLLRRCKFINNPKLKVAEVGINNGAMGNRVEKKTLP